MGYGVVYQGLRQKGYGGSESREKAGQRAVVEGRGVGGEGLGGGA